MKTGQKPDKGPVYIAKSGSVSVPIYRSQTRTSLTWVAAWYDGPTRRRKSFTDFDEAKRFADTRARTTASLGSASQALSGDDRLAYIRARSLLDPIGVSLDAAVTEYVEARKILAGRPMVPTVRELIAFARTQDSPPVRKVVEEFISAKESAGRSTRHMEDLRCRLGRFADYFGCPFSSVTVADVERWLGLMGVGHRTRANYLTATTSLVRFAERRGYIGKGALDLSLIERGKTHTEVAIFTPQEFKALLHGARADLVPYIAIGGFAGLRSAELCRLAWEEIGRDHIDVKAAKSKTRQRRLVPILPALAKWLEPLRSEGKICHLEEPWHVLKDYASKAGVEWKPNALRHSFGTYRLALVKSESQVALEMGNTPSMIFGHYRALATEETAREWFAI